MANDKQPENVEIPESAKADQSDDKLIPLGNTAEAGQANDLNRRLQSLEKDLLRLSERMDSAVETYDKIAEGTAGNGQNFAAELDEIRAQNSALRESLESLNAENTSISAEAVSLTRTLEETTSELDKRLETLQLELAAKITSVSDETVKQHDDLQRKHDNLSKRATTLTRKTTELGKKLDKQIEQTGAAISAIEARIQQAAEAALARHEEMTRRAEELQERQQRSEADQNAALTALATSVKADARELEARTEERATRLEAKLAEEKQALESRLEQTRRVIETNSRDIATLKGASENQETRIESLEDSTLTLEIATSRLDTQTSALEQASQSLHERLASLRETVDRNFFGLASALVVILIVVAALGWYQHTLWQSQIDRNATLSEQIIQQETQMAANELRYADDLARQEALNNQIARLQAENVQQADDISTHEEVLVALKDKIQTIEDQTDSLDGRVTQASPLRTFGADNVVHGPSWLLKQDASRFTIRMTTVDNKQALFDTAVRYGYYLKSKLAYFPVVENGQTRYALVYGNFANEAEAEKIAGRLPRPDFRHPPEAVALAGIQQQI